ncbi:MAG: c-type cytochrome [Planctomycetales bacterium]|nr:c-type cytochrome [Planctomycetales bacterium]
MRQLPIAISIQLALFAYTAVSPSQLIAAEREPHTLVLQPGVQLSLVAEHPALATPTGVDVDCQGRVWVVANHTHFRPDDYTGPELDEVLIFDNRGERRVFCMRTQTTTDLELGADGWVYLAERGRILRIQDTDGDGQGDLEEQLLTLTTEATYPHNGLCGLAWTTDGDLLFGLGENYAEPWTLSGVDGIEFRGTGEGGIFRCRPDGTALRRVAYGLWNPFAVCVRHDGTMFAADNDPGERPPCRLLHIVEGGNYGYQRAYGGETHHPFVCWNGQLRGTLPMIHPSGEAPCGIAPLGHGLLVSSWSDHSIYFYSLSSRGASFGAERVELVSGSRFFRPTCLALDRSTADSDTQILYFADWVDGRYEVHGYGRLWRLELDLQQADWLGPTALEPTTEAARLAMDLRLAPETFTLAQLFKYARGDDPFVAHAASLALGRRATTWKQSDVMVLASADRVQALLALKTAASTAANLLNVDPWIRAFLCDKDEQVQFETLRWIADARLIAYADQVEQLLDRSVLSYPLFEAAIAAWNTLRGHPEQGTRNLEMLLARVRDRNSAASLRAYALRLLPKQPTDATDGDATAGGAGLKFPAGLNLELLKELLAVGDPTLSLEVIRVLAGNPTVGQAMLAEIAADTNRSPQQRAEAVVGLAALAVSHFDLLAQLAGDEHQSLREEALRALRGVELNAEQSETLMALGNRQPELAALVEAALAPNRLAENRPALADTKAWLNRLESVPGNGDIESGRRIFHHPRLTNCARCHRHSGRGNVVGPDLSEIGDQRDPARLLQSVLQPSLQMAPEYRPTAITLNDGRTFTGIRLQSATFEALRDNNGQRRVFQRSDIESIKELDHSFMPDGLVYSLTDRELRDLLAFLTSSAE